MPGKAYGRGSVVVSVTPTAAYIGLGTSSPDGYLFILVSWNVTFSPASFSKTSSSGVKPRTRLMNEDFPQPEFPVTWLWWLDLQHSGEDDNGEGWGGVGYRNFDRLIFPVIDFFKETFRPVLSIWQLHLIVEIRIVSRHFWIPTFCHLYFCQDLTPSLGHISCDSHGVGAMINIRMSSKFDKTHNHVTWVH